MRWSVLKMDNLAVNTVNLEFQIVVLYISDSILYDFNSPLQMQYKKLKVMI